MDAWGWIAVVALVLAAVAYVAAVRWLGTLDRGAGGRRESPLGASADVDTRRQVGGAGQGDRDAPAKEAARAGRQAQVGGSDVLGGRQDLSDEDRQARERR